MLRRIRTSRRRCLRSTVGRRTDATPAVGLRRALGSGQRPVDLRLGQPDEGGVVEPSRSNGRWTRHRRRWREHPARARARDPAQTPRPGATVARTLTVRADDDGGGRVLVARPVTACPSPTSTWLSAPRESARPCTDASSRRDRGESAGGAGRRRWFGRVLVERPVTLRRPRHDRGNVARTPRGGLRPAWPPSRNLGAASRRGGC